MSSFSDLTDVGTLYISYGCIYILFPDKSVFGDYVLYFQVNPSHVIILEGILIFHDPRVRELMNMKIFVDTGYFLLITSKRTSTCLTFFMHMWMHIRHCLWGTINACVPFCMWTDNCGACVEDGIHLLCHSLIHSQYDLKSQDWRDRP